MMNSDEAPSTGNAAMSVSAAAPYATVPAAFGARTEPLRNGVSLFDHPTSSELLQSYGNRAIRPRLARCISTSLPELEYTPFS